MPIRMVLIKILSLVCLALPVSVLAGQASELAAADNGTRAELIEQWAATPSPAMIRLLTALQEGAFYTDAAGKPYLQTEAGWVDAETGAAVQVAEDTLDALMINNRVRGALDAALAITKLTAADVAVRKAAIQSLQELANPALLPVVEKQLALESDAALKQQLALLVANMQLAHADPKVRMAALQSLATSNDPAIRSRIEPLTQAGTEADAQVRAAATKSLQSIKHRLQIQEFAGHAFSGLSLGSILLLAALGLAITYGLLGVINMAHGEMLMIGAYATYVVQGLFRSYLPGLTDWYLLAALPVAFLSAGLVGIVLERLVIRHLYGRPLETLLATWGISLFLIQTVRVIFGAQNVAVENPSWMSGGWEITAALTLPYNRMVIIGFAIAVLVFTWLLLNKTRLGLFVRAVTQNRRMADCVGVPTGRIDMLAFGLGSGIAGLAGVALTQVGNVGPDLGQSYIIDSFMVVVLGGVGQLAGSVIAALGLGVVGKVLEPSIGAVLGKIAILVFIILFIQKRPMGLFALKGRSVE